MANAKTIDDLRTEANDIRKEENEGANTASRVGTMFRDIIDYLETLNTSSDSEDEGGSGGGGGGGVSLNEPLSSINNDLSRTPSRENQVLVYQNGVWDYGDYGGGSTPTSGVTWDALASEDATKQIHLSHLTTALNSYSFWGRNPVNGVVSGDMIDVGSITMNGKNHTFLIDVDDDGNLRFNGNIYATGGVSALGNSSSGGGGGGGSNVSWEQLENSGKHIATITIDNKETYVYAPTSGGAGGATTLGGLNDVTLNSPSNGEYLKHNGNTWVNAAFGPVITDLNKITGNPNNGSYLINYDGLYWSLTEYRGQSSGISQISYSGTGNAVTEASISGNTLTLTRGKTFLTSIPVANATTLGGIKVGSHLKISNEVLSVNGDNLSVASAATAASAEKAGRLSEDTTYAAWGQTYWQGGKPKAINGNMNGVNDIYMNFSDSSTSSHAIKMKCFQRNKEIDTVLLNNSDTLSFGYGARTNGLITEIQGQKIVFAVNNSTPRVEAGEFTNTGLFYVKQGTQGIRIGDGVIKWNSSNNSLYVERAADAGGGAANFYASGGVSALGFSGGGSPSISSATIGTLNSTRINFAGHAGTWSIKTSFPSHEQLDFSYGGGGSGDIIVTFPNTRADKYFIGSSNRYLCWKDSHLVFNNNGSEIQIA